MKHEFYNQILHCTYNKCNNVFVFYSKTFCNHSCAPAVYKKSATITKNTLLLMSKKPFMFSQEVSNIAVLFISGTVKTLWANKKMLLHDEQSGQCYCVLPPLCKMMSMKSSSCSVSWGQTQRRNMIAFKIVCKISTTHNMSTWCEKAWRKTWHFKIHFSLNIQIRKFCSIMPVLTVLFFWDSSLFHYRDCVCYSYYSLNCGVSAKAKKE